MNADTIFSGRAINMRPLAALIIFTSIITVLAAGCSPKTSESATEIKSYRDIPGITEEEIRAIEKLKSERAGFSYGIVPSTESFTLPDGTHAGFTVLFCDLLSDLFDIPFVYESLNWENLKAGIDVGDIDFTNELTPTPDRLLTYFMTNPIAQRELSVFFKKGTLKIESERDLNGLKIGFYKGAITEKSINNFYANLRFEAVDIHNAPEAAEKLESGDIDAFIVDSTAAVSFRGDDSITHVNALPLVYTPVSMSTANPALEPVISAVDRYLAAGGIDKIIGLYREGSRKYSALELAGSFTDKEKAYIDDLLTRGAKVPIALQYDDYPVCFYDENRGGFHGIAPEVLQEVSLLTGIEFEVKHGKDAPWHELLEMLRTNEVALVSELLYTEERTKEYIWVEKPFYTSKYSFISRLDYPDIEFYQIPLTTVGIVKETALQRMYKAWFPGKDSHIPYNTHDEAFEALERGEIDLFMTSDHLLLYQLNYREKPGYKINISIDEFDNNSNFGLNKNEEMLRSIISKSMNYINTDRIVRNWTSRVYDYTRRMAEKQTFYLTVFTTILAVMLVILFAVLITMNRAGKRYKEQAVTISAIYKSLPDLMFSKDTNYRYTSVNHIYQKFTGCGEEELLGKTSHEIPGLNKRISDDVLATEQRVINEKTTVKLNEWLIYPDGSRRYYETIKVPLIHNGKARGLFAIGRDTTELLDAMEASQKNHERTRIMLDTMPMSCNLMNKDHHFIDCNDEFVKLMGFKNKQDLLTRAPHPAFVSPVYQPDGRLSSEVIENNNDMALRGVRCVFEWEHQLLDGTLIPTSVTLVRVYYDNDYAVLAYVRDIREHTQR